MTALPMDLEEPVASCVPHCYTQEVSLACRLPAGAYAIMPSTYQPQLPGSFTLSVARRIYRLSDGKTTRLSILTHQRGI